MAMTEFPRPRARAAVAMGEGALARGLAIDLYDQVAGLLLLGLVLVVGLTFRDYGIIWDEEWQNLYGKKLLALYASGFADRSALHYSNLYLYGGLFDLVAATLNLVSPLGEYETRHLLGGLVGVLGMAGTWALARRVAGPRAGLVALALIAMTPVYYGHMFFNPKDVPFACGMIWSLYWVVRVVEAMPRPGLRQVAPLGLVLGMTLATRIGAVIIGLYLGVGILAFALREARARRDARAFFGSLWTGSLAVLPALPIAYAAMGLGWPWGVAEIANPFKALWTFSHFGWEGLVEINGRWISALRLPWTYLPLFLGVQLPEVLLFGLGVAFIFFLARLNGRPPFAPRRHDLGLSIVALAALFPIAYFIAFRPNAYHTLRHFLFVIPPLAVIAAWGIDCLLRAANRRSLALGLALGAAFCGAVVLQGLRFAALHPNEYISYNAFVGGVRGAQGRFELDYWGNSLAEAAESLAARVHREGPARAGKAPYLVKVCGYPLSAGYYLPPSFKVTEDPRVADFFVALTQSGCDKTVTGQEIAKVTRDGTVLAVVKDRRVFTRGNAQIAGH